MSIALNAPYLREGSQKAVMSADKVLEVMLDEATGVDDDSNVLWDADFAEGFMKGGWFATKLMQSDTVQPTMCGHVLLCGEFLNGICTC